VVHHVDLRVDREGRDRELVIVDDSKPEQDIRTDLIENLKRRGDYVIVAYQRKAVGQEGPGHISPLGAYDTESDSFLVLDVNPASADWVWMPTAALIKGMRTFDAVENRGYILVETP
jgi:Phytochelatin synthase